jgi:hypothetical protein
MKKLLFLTAGAIVVFEVAKYLGINSMDDVKKMVMPRIRELVKA